MPPKIVTATGSGVEVTAPSSQTAVYHTRTLLPCTFTVNNPPIAPKFLVIFWHFERTQLVRYDNKQKVVGPGVSIDEKEVIRGNASLSIHNVTISNHGAYVCLVIYSPDRQEKKIQLNVQAVPDVKIHKKYPPRNEKSQVQCSVTNFFPWDIKVTWLRDGQPLEGSVSENFQNNADGTYNVNSSVTITATNVKNNPTITCQVEHESLQYPIQDGFQVQYGATPSVKFTSSKTPNGEGQIYVCEASGYNPEALEINWLLDGKRTGLSRRIDDGLFNKEIYYRIVPSKGNQPTQISCEVQHETLSNPIMETLQVDQFNEFKKTCHYGLTAIVLVLAILAYGIIAAGWYFIVKKKCLHKFQVSPIHREQKRTDDEEVTLYCMAFNCEMEAQVTWTIKEDGGETVTVSEINTDEENVSLISKDYTVKTDHSQTPSDKLYNIFTALSFKTVESKNSNREVICRFHCGGRSQERKLLYRCDLKKPEMAEQIMLSLSGDGEVLCSATLVNLYPKNIQINWSCGVGHYQELSTTNNQITKISDYSYNAVSECRVPGHLFRDPGFRVRVTWSHQSLDEAEYQEVSATDCPWQPVMDEIMIPLWSQSTEAKLQCTISGYFLGQLDVMWMRREPRKQELYPVSPSDKYRIPVLEITQESDKTFTCTASLIVSVSAVTDHGAEFICQVKHPTLPTPLEKKTGELSVRGIPFVRNVFQDNRHIILEVDSFYPQDLRVTWERADSENGSYKMIPDSDIRNYSSESSDGTYRIISTCADISIYFYWSLFEKFFKATVKHEALKSPLQLMFFRSRDGEVYEIS